jgi:K+-transporting ATPase A subunit
MMHDSSAPLTGLVELINMLINAIWGGVGCGLQQFMIYLLRSIYCRFNDRSYPELFGRKIEAAEIKLLAIIILIQPLVILAFTALSLSVPGISGISNLDHMVLAKCSMNMSLHLPTMVQVLKVLETTLYGGMLLVVSLYC